MPPNDIKRRKLLSSAAIGTLLLGGCDRLAEDDTVQRVLASAEGLTRRVQRLLGGAHTLAPEYTEADLSPVFKANGTLDPDDDDYQDMAAKHFVDWRLEVTGLVERQLRLSLEDLRAMPPRTQITRHDCVEGWSCIGKWKGAVLSDVLRQAGPLAGARFVVFHCADLMDNADPDSRYYESIGIEEAFHPQTILAYDMNDAPLPVAHGAPLRVRVERQLGYKMAKYVMRIELVDSFAHIANGNGGYWEDQGYAWYAGI